MESFGVDVKKDYSRLYDDVLEKAKEVVSCLECDTLYFVDESGRLHLLTPASCLRTGVEEQKWKVGDDALEFIVTPTDAPKKNKSDLAGNEIIVPKHVNSCKSDATVSLVEKILGQG